MEFINQIASYLQDFAAKSQTEYHVNPWIFLILFFGSAIPLYYGYYRIGKSALKLEQGKLTSKKVDRHELKTGIIISVIAWWVPYVYVIIFGRLPMYLWIVFFIFILTMGVFFIFSLRKRISEARSIKGE